MSFVRKWRDGHRPLARLTITKSPRIKIFFLIMRIGVFSIVLLKKMDKIK